MVDRPRLRRLLEPDAALTVVRGARGSGKTVLVAQWLAVSGRPAVWIHVRPETSAPAPFVVALMLRIARIGMLPPEEVAASIDSVQRGTDPWSELESRLIGLDAPLTLVLDDASRADRELLAGLIRALRGSIALHVVALEDSASLLDHDGLDSVLDRVEISAAQLRFDADEAAEMLGVDRGTAEELVALTGGLAVAMRALTREGVARRSPAEVLQAATRAAESYLALRLDPADRGLAVAPELVRASAADTLTAELAIRLTGLGDAERLLDDAERDGLGAWRTTSGDRVFSFTPLMRELLRKELARRSPAEGQRSTRIVIDWNLRNGREDQALELAIRLGDLDLASDVARRSWFSLSRASSVHDALSSVPVSRLKSHPLLITLLASSYDAIGIHRAKRMHLFRAAVAASRSPVGRHRPADRLIVRTSESSALRVLGHLQKAAETADEAIALAAGLGADEVEAIAPQLGGVFTQLGLTFYYAGRSSEAIAALTGGLAEATEREVGRGVDNLALLAGMHALEGDMRESVRFTELVLQRTSQREELRGSGGVFSRVARAMAALESFDAAGAERQLASIVHDRETVEHWRTIARVEAMTDLVGGAPAAALARLDSVAASHGAVAVSDEVRAELSPIRTLLHLATGDLAAAKRTQRRDAKPSAQTTVDRARVALVDGRPGDALWVLRGLDWERSAARIRAEAVAIELAALLRARDGERARAHRSFHRMSALLVGRGQRLALALVPADDLERIRAFDAAEGGSGLFDEVEPRSVLLRGAGRSPLTAREEIVLTALTRTSAVSDIAAELVVSTNTVKSQLQSIYRKLGATSRDEAIAIAVARHLIDPDRNHPG